MARRSFDDKTLAWVREMPLSQVLDKLRDDGQLFWRRDPDFVPEKDKRTVRLFLSSPSGFAWEVLVTEVRALQTDPARLMHQRLCGWIDPGKSGRVELDMLCGYVWPDQATPEAMKKRRQTARKALAELATVGWALNEYAKGKWEIKRPAQP